MKLREMFNKASEGKSKLSVNDFSKNHFQSLVLHIRSANQADQLHCFFCVRSRQGFGFGFG